MTFFLYCCTSLLKSKFTFTVFSHAHELFCNSLYNNVVKISILSFSRFLRLQKNSARVDKPAYSANNSHLISTCPAAEHCNSISNFSNQFFLVYSKHRDSTVHEFYFPNQTRTAKVPTYMCKILIRSPNGPRNSTIWHCESLTLFFSDTHSKSH